MSDLKVSLILQLKNLLKGGIGQVRGDLKGLKDEAKGLAGIKGPNVGGMSAYGAEARRSAAALRQLRHEQQILGASRAGAGGSSLLVGGSVLGRAVGGVGMGAIGAGLTTVLAATQLRDATKLAAENQRAMTRIAITGDASRSAQNQAAQDIERLAHKTALATKDIREGLDSLVAAGRSLPDAMKFLPSVANAAQASGAAVLDIAKSADAVSGSMEVAADKMEAAFDIMATGGKLGKFELKDMAQFLPELAPMAKEAGMKGTEGLTSLVAALQMVRKETGTSGEAATNLKNVFSKMFSSETEKKFEKMGVDLPKEMEKAKKEGKNLLDVFVELSMLATKGDLTKLPKLFEDMQAQAGMRALMNNRKAMKDMVSEIGKTSEGTVGRDLNRVLGDSQTAMDRVAGSAARFGKNIGNIVNASRAASGVMDALATGINKVNEAMESGGEIQRKLDEAGIKPLGKLKTKAEAEAEALLARKPLSDAELQDMRDGGFHRQKVKDTRTGLQKAEDARAETARAKAALDAQAAAESRKLAARDPVARAKEAEDIAKESGTHGQALFYARAQRKAQREQGATPLKNYEHAEPMEKRLGEILSALDTSRKRKEAGGLGLTSEEENRRLEEAKALLGEILYMKRQMDGGTEPTNSEIGAELKKRLDEVKDKSKETGDSVKTNLTLDMTSQGANAATTFAAGLASGTGPAVAAAQSLAAQVRAAMTPAVPAMAPPAASPERRPTGGSAAAPRSTNVQVAAIHINGVSDPDKAGKAAVRELAAAVRSSLSGAHHDGVA